MRGAHIKKAFKSTIITIGAVMAGMMAARPSFAQLPTVENAGANQNQPVVPIFIPNLGIGSTRTLNASPLRTFIRKPGGNHELINHHLLSPSHVPRQALATPGTAIVQTQMRNGSRVITTLPATPRLSSDKVKKSTLELSEASVESQVTSWTKAFDPMIRNARPNGDLGIALKTGIDEYHGDSPATGDESVVEVQSPVARRPRLNLGRALKTAAVSAFLTIVPMLSAQSVNTFPEDQVLYWQKRVAFWIHTAIIFFAIAAVFGGAALYLLRRFQLKRTIYRQEPLGVRLLEWMKRQGTDLFQMWRNSEPPKTLAPSKQIIRLRQERVFLKPISDYESVISVRNEWEELDVELRDEELSEVQKHLIRKWLGEENWDIRREGIGRYAYAVPSSANAYRVSIGNPADISMALIGGQDGHTFYAFIFYQGDLVKVQLFNYKYTSDALSTGLLNHVI